MDKQAERILSTLRRLYPKVEMHRTLDEVAGERMPRSAFKTFVWHTMAKSAVEHLSGRKWELVAGDLRHKATEMAVIYAMHCIYERAARGQTDLALAWQDKEMGLWSWGSRAG